MYSLRRGLISKSPNNQANPENQDNQGQLLTFGAVHAIILASLIIYFKYWYCLETGIRRSGLCFEGNRFVELRITNFEFRMQDFVNRHVCL